MGLFDAPSRLVNREYGDIYRQKADRLHEDGRQFLRIGRLEEAEEKARQLIAVQSKVVGERHPDYASGLSLLAEILLARDELSDAETLLQRAMEIRKKSLGDQHPDYASSLDLLARLMLRWEDHVGAEPLLRKALEIRRSVLGVDHPDYASSLAMLAEVVGKSDEYDIAEPLFREAIETLTRVHGESHPEVADVCTNFAQLLIRHGETTEAESLLRNAIEIYRQAYGERHPSYVSSTTNLASLLHLRGDFHQAEPLWRLLLDMRRQSSGEKHPECAYIQIQLAQILQRQGDMAGAEALLREAAEIRKYALGERHPEYATSLTHLAATLQRTGDLQGAEPLLRQALAIRKDVLGVRNPEYGTSLMNLALLVQKRGDITWAKMLLKEAVDVRRAVYGENHPDYAHSLVSLGEIVGQQGEPTKAEAMIRRALEIRGETLGEYHPAFAANLCSLAAVLKKQGDFQESETLLRRALHIRKEVLGEEHPDFITNLGNLAWLLQRKGDFAGAERLLTHSLELRRRLLGVKHPEYLQNLERLKQLQKDGSLPNPSVPPLPPFKPTHDVLADTRAAYIDDRHDQPHVEIDHESDADDLLDAIQGSDLNSYSNGFDQSDIESDVQEVEGDSSHGSTEQLLDHLETRGLADDAIHALGDEHATDLEEEEADFDRRSLGTSLPDVSGVTEALLDEFGDDDSMDSIQEFVGRMDVEGEGDEYQAFTDADDHDHDGESIPEALAVERILNAAAAADSEQPETDGEDHASRNGEWNDHSAHLNGYAIDSEHSVGRQCHDGDGLEHSVFVDDTDRWLDEAAHHDHATDTVDEIHDALTTSEEWARSAGDLNEGVEANDFLESDLAEIPTGEDLDNAPLDQDEDDQPTSGRFDGPLEAALSDAENRFSQEAALEGPLNRPGDDEENEPSDEGSLRPHPLRSDSMNLSSSDLSQELSDLSDRFSTLGEKLLASARQLHAPGAPPSEELIETIGSCRRDFIGFRERALGLAHSLDVHEPRFETLNSLQDVSNLLDAIAEVELHHSKNEELRRRGLSVLDRVLAIQHSGGIDFAPLRECQQQALGLRNTLEQSSWKALPVEVEQLTEGEHHFAHLLSLIEDHEDLGDDLWASHHESVSQNFGKPLAAAAARSKLSIPQSSGMALVGH